MDPWDHALVSAHRGHQSIIDHVARTVLAPLGLQRKGRSRFWYEDRGWQALFVEFQPSSWSKGTYCNVGAMWLWSPNQPSHWGFDLCGRMVCATGEFASFAENPSHFEEQVSALATAAAHEIVRLRQRFEDVTAVAAYYRELPPDEGWPGYNGGVALGLAGHKEEAAARFLIVAANAAHQKVEWVARLGQHAASMADLLKDAAAFRDAIETQVIRTREGLRLNSVPHPLAWSEGRPT